jgi:hypothetical protein
MIPKGPIFNTLRSLALEAIPDGIRVSPKENNSLSNWFDKGSYNVAGINTSEMTIHADVQELGTALLSDVERLSNHALEQVQEMICFSNDTRIRSSGWNVVTIYYFAYFVAQGLLRLLGRPIFFLDRQRVRNLTNLFLKGKSALNAGTYLLLKKNQLSATQAAYTLKLTKKKPHEATWLELLGGLRKYVENPLTSTNLSETLFYDSITTKNLFDEYRNYEWPSMVRNIANYRVGYAYKLVQNVDVAATKKLWGRWETGTPNEMLKSTISLCVSGDKTKFRDQVWLLHDIAISLFLVFLNIYQELVKRRNIDNRWEVTRKQFFKRAIMDKDATIKRLFDLK